jgi:hypothetical protein
MPFLPHFRQVARRRLRNERLVLRTTLDRYQCRSRLSGIDQPKPVERIGIPGFGGSVHAYAFRIGRGGPGAKCWADAQLHREENATHIELIVDRGRLDFIVEVGCAGLGLAMLALAVAALLGELEVRSVDILILGLVHLFAASLLLPVYWWSAN